MSLNTSLCLDVSIHSTDDAFHIVLPSLTWFALFNSEQRSGRCVASCCTVCVSVCVYYVTPHAQFNVIYKAVNSGHFVSKILENYREKGSKHLGRQGRKKPSPLTGKSLAASGLVTAFPIFACA